MAVLHYTDGSSTALTSVPVPPVIMVMVRAIMIIPVIMMARVITIVIVPVVAIPRIITGSIVPIARVVIVIVALIIGCVVGERRPSMNSR